MSGTFGSLPFTRDEFLGVFAAYNEAVWPAEAVAYGLAVIAMAGLVQDNLRVQRLAGLALAAMWLWTGIVYHWMFFAPINGAAHLFGALFVAEGIWLFLAALRPRALELRWRGGFRRFVGGGLILYALILYPAVGALAGDAWPRMPAFGITPCPLTLFTLGVLLFARRGTKLWVIPLLWSAIGGSATFQLGMVQDWMLLVAAPLSAALFTGEAWRRRRRRPVRGTA